MFGVQAMVLVEDEAFLLQQTVLAIHMAATAPLPGTHGCELSTLLTLLRSDNLPKEPANKRGTG